MKSGSPAQAPISSTGNTGAGAAGCCLPIRADSRQNGR
jgi:hypothetical protein